MTEEHDLTSKMVEELKKEFHSRKDAEIIARAIQKMELRLRVKIQWQANVFIEHFPMKLKRESQPTSVIADVAGLLRP